MGKKDYYILLKSPLWQKKRLEIMQRDNFSCRSCGCKDKMLHVHHLYYVKGKNPWDYPNDAFLTLCEECHNKIHKKSKKPTKDIIKSAIGKKVFFRGLIKEKRITPTEKIVLSFVLTHEKANNTEIAKTLSISRKTVIVAIKKIKELGLIENKELIMQHGFFILEKEDRLTGELLVFYSYLRDKSAKYNYQLDTFKSKFMEEFGKSKVAITKLLNRLYEENLAKRLDNGKLQIY